MTDDARHDAIMDMIQQHTAMATSSREAARESLIAEGVYTPSGELRPEYGGEKKVAERR